MTLPETLYKRYPPAADSFLKSVCPLVTDSDLEEIAAYDRGYLKDEHLPVLRNIRDCQCLPASLEVRMSEVLHLGRWCAPDSSDIAGHTRRAFCGALLLRANTTPGMEDNDFGDEDTLIITLESAEVLGRECSLALIKFLLWCVPQETIWSLENRPLYVLAILILMLTYDFRLSPLEREAMLTYFYWAETQEATWEGERLAPEYHHSTLSPYYGTRGNMWKERVARLKIDYPFYTDVVVLAEHLMN